MEHSTFHEAFYSGSSPSNSRPYSWQIEGNRGVQYLSQGHFEMSSEEAKDQTTNLPVGAQFPEHQTLVTMLSFYVHKTLKSWNSPREKDK